MVAISDHQRASHSDGLNSYLVNFQPFAEAHRSHLPRFSVTRTSFALSTSCRQGIAEEKSAALPSTVSFSFTDSMAFGGFGLADLEIQLSRGRLDERAADLSSPVRVGQTAMARSMARH